MSLNPMRLLVFLWFLFIASASLWLPAYKGNFNEEETLFFNLTEAEALLIPLYGLIAGLAAIGVRGRSRSVGQALLSALPVLALLAGAAVVGDLQNEQQADPRGEPLYPLYLYFGVALWASWAALVLSAAIISRAKWSGFGGIGLGFLVAALGLFLFAI